MKLFQIRRMKQLEQEKDSLLQGLEVVERTRDWYHKQIALVTEKQNYVEKTSCSVSNGFCGYSYHNVKDAGNHIAIWQNENKFSK